MQAQTANLESIANKLENIARRVRVTHPRDLETEKMKWAGEILTLASIIRTMFADIEIAEMLRRTAEEGEAFRETLDELDEIANQMGARFPVPLFSTTVRQWAQSLKGFLLILRGMTGMTRSAGRSADARAARAD
ncbi:MAG TPA: hypothetical protein VMV50_03335 [Candidatus Paceibacterota bacterium]|nr:hypothetical protein [Candidatus Paceibacterota bacterium]